MTTQTITIPPIEIPACGDNAVISINISVAVTSPCVVGGGGDTGGGGPAWLPAGAVAYADFVNGHYYAGGQEVAVTDMIADDTTLMNFRFDAANIVADTGYVVSIPSGYNYGGGKFIGDALTSIVAGATIVLEAYVSTDALAQYAIELYLVDAPAQSTGWYLGLRSPTNGNSYVGDFDAAFASAPRATGDAVNRIAATLTADALAVSVNGSTAAAAGPPLTLTPPNWAGFKSAHAGDIYRKIIVYPPKNDADLPALSTVA